MRPYEEYLKRHSITDLPIARHDARGSLLLRTTDSTMWKNRWIILNFQWIHNDHHPGHYQIEINYPIHDGYLSDKLFTQRMPINKKWDEFEDFFIEWSEILKGVKAVHNDDVRELQLAAWEIFVFAYDGWFQKQSYEIKRILFESLDRDRKVDYRFRHYQDIGIYLATHHPAIVRAWKYEVLARVQNYSNWLAQIVDSQCSKTQERKSLPPSKLELA